MSATKRFAFFFANPKNSNETYFGSATKTEINQPKMDIFLRSRIGFDFLKVKPN